MAIPEVTAFTGRNGCRLDFSLALGGRVCLFVLKADLIRVLFLPDDAPRLARTWTICPDGQDCPWDGRARIDDFGFAAPNFSVTDREGGLRVDTDVLSANVQYSPFRIVWSFPQDEADGAVTFAQDRETEPYRLDPDGTVFHALARVPDDLFYGLGEKTGALNRAGRRFRMLGLDARSYDAAMTDPLYKHVPFTITRDARTGSFYGLLYDNLATSVFDLGCEIDGPLGSYRHYLAEGGDLDYYLIFGPRVRDVVAKYAALTGAMAFGPKWSLGFSWSATEPAETGGAVADMLEFAQGCATHEIPCEGLQLTPGEVDGRRHALVWNRQRIPDPPGLCETLRQHGLRVTANVEPCLSDDHPLYAEAAEAGLFINGRRDGRPGGGPVAHLDFTNAGTLAWWKGQMTSALLENGVAGCCNDRNEFGIRDRDTVCDGFGSSIETRLVRPLLGMLMTRASREAMLDYAPEIRPHLVSRSACPGSQRYAQAWTGDNATNWKTLKYSIRMGVGLGLSGLFDFGHDVGGFAGPSPDAELLVRWVQSGVFNPRFAMRSQNDDGSSTLPWMHDEATAIVRDAIRFRYHLMPYLYTLYHRAHRDHQPMIRPTFYDFESDLQTYRETNDFMLGDHLLVAPVVEAGATERSVYLPKGPDGWIDIHHGVWYGSGKSVTVAAPLEVVPIFAPDGAILPMNAIPRPVAPLEDTERMLWVFPHRREGRSTFRLYEDDGETSAYRRGHFCEIEIVMESTPDAVHLFAHREGVFEPGYSAFDVVLPDYERRPIRLNGWPVDRASEPLTLTF